MSNNEFNLSRKIVRVTSGTHASNATFLVEPKAQRINLNRISSGTINGFMCMWGMGELTQNVQTGHVAFWHTLRRIHERQFVSICCVRVCAVHTPCNRLWHSSQLSNIMLSNNIMQNFSLIIPKVQYCTRRHRLNPFSYQKCSAKCSNKIRWESISRSGAGTTIANEIWGELRLCTLQPPDTPIFPLTICRRRIVHRQPNKTVLQKFSIRCFFVVVLLQLLFYSSSGSRIVHCTFSGDATQTFSGTN